MLEQYGEIKKACKAGANVAELAETGQRLVQTTRGEAYEPVFEHVYLVGKPFGSAQKIIAPVALAVGDVLVVDAEEYEPIRVERDGEVVWGEVDGDE